MGLNSIFLYTSFLRFLVNVGLGPGSFIALIIADSLISLVESVLVRIKFSLLIYRIPILVRSDSTYIPVIYRVSLVYSGKRRTLAKRIPVYRLLRTIGIGLPRRLAYVCVGVNVIISNL